jgi:hypothetical protein
MNKNKIILPEINYISKKMKNIAVSHQIIKNKDLRS